jgi:hypothetical protein
MKVKKRNLFLATMVMSILVVIFITLSWTLSAQKKLNDDIVSPLSDELMATEPVKVVKNFWELSEKGDLEEAGKLRTDTSGGFTISVKGDSKVKGHEEIIYNSGWTLISIEQIDIIADDRWEIAVKVRKKDDKNFYLFHTVVKNGDKWKIFGTSR